MYSVFHIPIVILWTSQKYDVSFYTNLSLIITVILWFFSEIITECNHKRCVSLRNSNFKPTVWVFRRLHGSDKIATEKLGYDIWQIKFVRSIFAKLLNPNNFVNRFQSEVEINRFYILIFQFESLKRHIVWVGGSCTRSVDKEETSFLGISWIANWIEELWSPEGQTFLRNC